jgi:hypothetical protein
MWYSQQQNRNDVGPPGVVCGWLWGLTLRLHSPDGLSFSSTLQPGEEMEACEELALALSRGLQLDTQRSSRDSLQCSSGYSTQTTTPCCSEDTIPSQGTRSPGFVGSPRLRRQKASGPSNHSVTPSQQMGFRIVLSSGNASWTAAPFLIFHHWVRGGAQPNLRHMPLMTASFLPWHFALSTVYLLPI